MLHIVPQDKYVEAMRLYRRALAIRERALGPDHPDVILSLTNIAELLGAQVTVGWELRFLLL